MLGRILFSTLLLASTVVLHLGEGRSLVTPPLLSLYGLVGGVFLLSLVYALLLPRIRRELPFAYLQLALDTLTVSLIILLTGGFASIFSFLYLVVIIYSSMLLYRLGSLVVATLCALQYALLVGAEYLGDLRAFEISGQVLSALDYTASHVLYKVTITVLACYAVALLSSLLAEQTRKTRRRLLALEDHIKRVEKMASMGEMAAGMAHEIKNPLASLGGAIQLLREDLQFNPEHDRLMQIVLRETDRLSTLVTNFLLFARPQASRIDRIRLEEVLADSVALFEKDSKCRGRIEVSLDLLPGLWVEMDPAHLRQIVWNLLLNAAEAIDGSGHIEVRTAVRKPRHLILQVCDSGCGVERQILPSIFDPFFTTKPKGTGLGLSIVHRLVESYGGWVELESEIGKGTTFNLIFKQADRPNGLDFDGQMG